MLKQSILIFFLMSALSIESMQRLRRSPRIIVTALASAVGSMGIVGPDMGLKAAESAIRSPMAQLYAPALEEATGPCTKLFYASFALVMAGFVAPEL